MRIETRMDRPAAQGASDPKTPPVEAVLLGEYACFTRPETKVERVSYPLPTPSAARGMLEAIYWKPEFRYRIRRIEILRPIAFVSLLRNELTDTVPDPRRKRPRPIDIAERRTQRHTLALRNVAYRICADIEPRTDVPEPIARFRDAFRRRVDKGRCFHRPALGCREFAADFLPPERYPGPLKPVPVDLPPERMLFDIDYAADPEENQPRFFVAHVRRGVLHVPAHLYDRPERHP
ncbi:MAG: type I-C CRISPR-associated protein Cas5c [Capsulimonadales bacterium]|nr:type I-C CRISPR-associated protein Cas5c [Capsulimonadales bacterium]